MPFFLGTPKHVPTLIGVLRTDVTETSERGRRK